MEQEQRKESCGCQEGCCVKTKHRDSDEYKSLIHRLNRIEGQVRGIRSMLEEELREEHIERLVQKQCQPPAGVSFLDLLTNFERVSDHAYNIAGYVKDEM